MATTTTAAKSLAPCCEICDNEENLLRCAGCKVIRYCTKDHQTADWPQHKKACSRIKKSRSAFELVEQKLRDDEPDIFSDQNVGHFWGLIETRPYMTARFGVVEATLKVKTFDAAQSTLDHLMDMLRLCRGDNMGVRDLVPHLMLRLGKDQDCYDFIKWWATADPDGRYDWGDTSLPYLNVRDADVYEPVDYLCSRFPALSYIIAVTLLKLRLLLALKKSEGSNVLHDIEVNANHTDGDGKISPEIVNQIRSDALQGTIIGDLRGRKPAQLIEDLLSQIEKLYKTVDKANKYFWPALMRPGGHLKTRPEFFSFGTKEEMQLKLQYSFDSWQENPAALAVIQKRYERS